MIGDAYCFVCELKIVQIFTIFMKNLEFKAEKKIQLETNSKLDLSKKYYYHLDMF